MCIWVGNIGHFLPMSSDPHKRMFFSPFRKVLFGWQVFWWNLTHPGYVRTFPSCMSYCNIFHAFSFAIDTFSYIDTKREKTLDENNRACEKVNSSTVVSKIDSSPQSKQRISHPLMVEPAAPTSSSKSCPPKKEAGIAAFVQNNGLGFINQDPSESQNVPIKAHCMDKAPRQEDYHKMLAHQKSKEKESKPSTMCSTSLEAMPSTSKSVSGIEYEVIRTR